MLVCIILKFPLRKHESERRASIQSLEIQACHICLFPDVCASMKRTVGILIFPGFEVLDVFGPMEMFAYLPDQVEVKLIAQTADPVCSAQGVSVVPHFGFETQTYIDILLIPGGRGTRVEVNNELLINWILQRSIAAQLVLSVCTGAGLLAKTGLLNGLKATTNKIAFQWVESQGPAVEWQKSARWVDAGKFITSSGVSAGMDMSLHVIGRLYGDEARDEVCRRTEYIINADPENDPFAIAG